MKPYWLVPFAVLCFWILQHKIRENQHISQNYILTHTEILSSFCILPILTLGLQTVLCWQYLLQCKYPWSLQCAIQKKIEETKQLILQNATPMIPQYLHKMPSPLSHKRRQKMHFCISCFFPLSTGNLDYKLWIVNSPWWLFNNKYHKKWNNDSHIWLLVTFHTLIKASNSRLLGFASVHKDF